MGIRMVRQPSQTPNVTNIDDIVPFRYAYGDQNGYVIGKGNEISHTIDGSTFRVNSGRVVLQGVETDIDANGVSFTIDNASETRYFVVYYEVNLATQTTSIKLSNYDTVGYPNIELGDDLTANSSGIARMELYRFTATSGAISNVQKVAKAIEYSGTALVGYNIDKGTVEERLTKLGFKEGIATFTSNALNYINGNSSYIKLYRQGNYVIGKMKLVFQSPISIVNFFGWDGIMANIPSDFYPLNSNNTKFFIGAGVRATMNGVHYDFGLTTPCLINLIGDMSVHGNSVLPIIATSVISEFSGDFYFGYEAKPL